MVSKSAITDIGPWSEIKLEIIKKYAQAYAIVLAKYPNLHHVYIDAFAGAGRHLSRTSGEIVDGSPKIVLEIEPHFKEYYFIDLEKDKVSELKKLAEQRKPLQLIHVYEGDCNEKLKEIFPQVKYEDFRRGLCLLDPYGLHLEWEIIQTAGKMRSIEIFINFPVYDMNLNALWKQPDKLDEGRKTRMNKFWGDDSWQKIVFRPKRQKDLFVEGSREKIDNATEAIVEAFKERLNKCAGFAHVPEPIPMKNTKGNILYFIYFASNNKAGYNIANSIFRKVKKEEKW